MPWPYYRGVLPFCVLLATFCVRPWLLIPVSVLGMLASWRLAFIALNGMEHLLGSPDMPSFGIRALYFAGGGVVGALGVAASAGMCDRGSCRLRPFVIIGLTGALAAAVFAFDRSLGYGFAIWQATVGSIVYCFARRPL